MASPTTPNDPNYTTTLTTKILPVNPSSINVSRPQVNPNISDTTHLDDWELTITSPETQQNLELAAHHLRHTDHPVAFPTETVYGLGADATRPAAVSGVYAAKRRPADNPLIVHVHSLTQLRSLLRPITPPTTTTDPIPPIYHPLIARFWPGPLTILLPLPSTPTSPLAPQTTASLPTFGARMPSSRVALALLKLAARPLAAPSANASTRPSPTTAAHVAADLGGRIEVVVDGGACAVGVESTVVDGLGGVPVVLRPGGVGIDEVRAVPGWEGVRVGYEDRAKGVGKAGDVTPGPRAPGMKYKHYSPRAPVVLFEVGAAPPDRDDLARRVADGVRRVGIMRTRGWPGVQELFGADDAGERNNGVGSSAALPDDHVDGESTEAASDEDAATTAARPHHLRVGSVDVTLWDANLGPSTRRVAWGLFSGLRELDARGVDVILVEGVDEKGGDVAAAVMNRLRKAAGG